MEGLTIYVLKNICMKKYYTRNENEEGVKKI